MNTPTYQGQERKIHEAYIKDEINPYNGNFCFCGTLAPLEKGVGWVSIFYDMYDFKKMEWALLSTICKLTLGGCDPFFSDGKKYDIKSNDRGVVKSHPNYENALFEGMVAALEVLKQIHIGKGDTIQSTPSFEKRKLTHI